MIRLTQHIVVFLISVGVVLSQNNPAPRPASGSFNCPTGNTQIEHPNDCTKFIECHDGVGSVSSCPPQLVFNGQRRICDWPFNVQNSNCASNQPSPLIPQVSQICRNNPGNPTEAFIVAHPVYCNGLYFCSTNYLFAPCAFCPEGMYFSLESGACQDYLASGLDLNTVCQGRTFVQHADKVMRQIDGTCWPYANIPNPHKPLHDAIVSGGGRLPGGPQRSG